MSCSRQLLWYDMIPVFSWIALGGRCRACRAKISIQYPLVEAATGILFAVLGSWMPLSAYPVAVPLLVLYLCIAALLVAIAAYDIRHTIIPDLWVWGFVALAFFSHFLMPLPSGIEIAVFLCAGPVAALPLFVLWAFSRGRWMGLGDVKLSLGIGWLLGPAIGFVAVMFAFVIGAVISVCVLLPLPYIVKAGRHIGITSLGFSSARFTMRSEVPFGPFLIVSCILFWIMILYGVPVQLPV